MGLDAPQFGKQVATPPYTGRGCFHFWPQKLVQIPVIRRGTCDESTTGLAADRTGVWRGDRGSSPATAGRCELVPSGIPKVGDRTEGPIPGLDKLRALRTPSPRKFYFGIGLRLFPNLISTSVRCPSDFDFLLVSEQS